MNNKLQVTSIHPIRKGEQIFINYVDPNTEVTKRRKHLFSFYGKRIISCGLLLIGFQCDCPKCLTDLKAANLPFDIQVAEGGSCGGDCS